MSLKLGNVFLRPSQQFALRHINSSSRIEPIVPLPSVYRAPSLKRPANGGLRRELERLNTVQNANHRHRRTAARGMQHRLHKGVGRRLRGEHRARIGEFVRKLVEAGRANHSLSLKYSAPLGAPSRWCAAPALHVGLGSLALFSRCPAWV